MSRTKSAVARNAVNDAAVAAERPVLDRREWFQIYRHAYWVAIEREDEIWAVVASICPKQAVPSLRHSSPSPGRLRLAPGATAMKANGRRATSCGSCTASRPIISSPRSRPVPKANGEAESCNHWRRISPRRICVSSRTIMRVFPTRRCRQPAQTRRSWSGGGNWSSKVCQARTYRLARHATAMSGPEPRGPRSTTTARWRR